MKLSFKTTTLIATIGMSVYLFYDVVNSILAHLGLYLRDMCPILFPFSFMPFMWFAFLMVAVFFYGIYKNHLLMPERSRQLEVMSVILFAAIIYRFLTIAQLMFNWSYWHNSLGLDYLSSCIIVVAMWMFYAKIDTTKFSSHIKRTSSLLTAVVAALAFLAFIIGRFIWHMGWISIGSNYAHLVVWTIVLVLYVMVMYFTFSFFPKTEKMHYAKEPASKVWMIIMLVLAALSVCLGLYDYFNILLIYIPWLISVVYISRRLTISYRYYAFNVISACLFLIAFICSIVIETPFVQRHLFLGNEVVMPGFPVLAHGVLGYVLLSGCIYLSFYMALIAAGLNMMQIVDAFCPHRSEVIDRPLKSGTPDEREAASEPSVNNSEIITQSGDKLAGIKLKEGAIIPGRYLNIMNSKNFICCVAVMALIGCAKQQSQATRTTDENVDVTKIYNVVILDRSASMSPLREAAVQGYNGILEVVRTAQVQNAIEQQNYITLSFFNDSVTNVFDCDTIQSIPDLLLNDYRPQGNTALWDAVGISLDSLKVRLDSLENATAVVSIISDGLENASKHYSIYAVADRIDALKGQGVMFVFMGTNQDVAQTAASFHIDNYRVFEYTAEGMKEAWQSGIDASAGYYERMSQYNKDTKGMSKQERNDYYRDRNAEDGWFK